MKSIWSPSWYTEGRDPAFINNNASPYESFGGTKYLWGNMPAIDILALEHNEGPDYVNDLNLLFAGGSLIKLMYSSILTKPGRELASGDFRNVVKTVAALSTTYNKQLTVTLNDRDLDIVARNAIMLILLIAVEDTAAAVDCVLHIWYSAQIAKAHIELLDTTVRPLIQEMCQKITEKPDGQLLAKTWSWGNKAIRIVLSKEAWKTTLSYLRLPTGLSSQGARDLRLAVTLAPERKDHLERHLFALSPTQRVCFLKYRQDGILLPFGHSRSAYNIPNP
jgi:hypothetical protein